MVDLAGSERSINNIKSSQKTKIEGKSNIKYLNSNNKKGLTQKKKIGLSHTKIERKVFEFFLNINNEKSICECDTKNRRKKKEK